MPKKLTTEEWIAKARATHGDAYEYDCVRYVSSKVKVTIRCKTHGKFEQIADNHIRGKGCPSCGGSQSNTNEVFVAKAIDTHGESYDYSKVLYRNSHTKVEIVCGIHGSFYQTPTAHLGGQGCRICGNSSRLSKLRSESLGNVVDDLKVKFGSRITIDETTFTTVNNAAQFNCKSHGAFSTRVRSLLYDNADCPDCLIDAKVSRELDEIRGLLPDLIDLVHLSSDTKEVTLNCPSHGEFKRTLSQLRNGYFCFSCGKEIAISRRSASIKSRNALSVQNRQKLFIAKAREVHGDKYSYSRMVYISAREPIIIECPNHGEFSQTPDQHLQGGCRKCANEDLKGLYSERFFELQPDLKMAAATIYCLEVTLAGDTFFKLGITRTSLNKRFGQAKAKGATIKIIGVAKTTLYEAWKTESTFFERDDLERYQSKNRTLLREARLSPTELLTKLPDDWRMIINWDDY